MHARELHLECDEDGCMIVDLDEMAIAEADVVAEPELFSF